MYVCMYVCLHIYICIYYIYNICIVAVLWYTNEQQHKTSPWGFQPFGPDRKNIQKKRKKNNQTNERNDLKYKIKQWHINLLICFLGWGGAWGYFGVCVCVCVEGRWGCFAGIFVVFCQDLGGKHESKRINKKHTKMHIYIYIYIYTHIVLILCLFTSYFLCVWQSI